MTFAASNPSALRSLILVEGGFFPKPEPSPAALQPAEPCKAEPSECARLASLEVEITLTALPPNDDESILAWYLKRYLDLKLKMLEDQRYRESLDDISKM